MGRGRGGGGVAVNFGAEKILSNQFLYINWFTLIEHPPKISTGVSLEYPIWFVPGLAVVNIHIPMNWRI